MSDKRSIPPRGQKGELTDLDMLRGRLESMVDSLASEVEEFDTSPVNGRVYPADSIDYRENRGLVQAGSSPSYWGDLWSLTCCKHKMRQEHFFDYFREEESGVLRPTQPLFVFTTAGKCGSDRPGWAAERRRWLASVALVTHAFEGMDDYGRFLMEQNETAWKSRISTQDQDEGPEWALKYGDCHAVVEDGEVVGVDTPHPMHDHVSDSGTVTCGCNTRVDRESEHVFQDDNDTSLLKFASTADYWLSWSEPEFYWIVSNGPDAWGGGQGKRAYVRNGGHPKETVFDQLQERN